MKKTLGQIFEELNADNIIQQKIKEMGAGSEALQKQYTELNSMWQKKLIDDQEYKNRLETMNKDLQQQKAQMEKAQLMKDAQNRNIKNPLQNNLQNQKPTQGAVQQKI